MFSSQELSQFKQRGMSPQVIEEQLQHFRDGFPFLGITKPATVGDGVIRLTHEEADAKAATFDNASGEKNIIKFVPASGAASRMFKDLFSFMGSYAGDPALLENPKQKAVKQFFEKLSQFAFYGDLEKALPEGKTLEGMKDAGEYGEILRRLLEDEGLGYGSLPKGLLRFHRYEEGNRAPMEEHLVEAAFYAKGNGGVARLHFTVSPEHESKFKELLAEVKGHYEHKFGVKYEVGFSEQKLSTDTIAVDMSNKAFVEADGTILFRPGGHGALIENLNDLFADLVFIKNIDNVVPDGIKAETYRYKKALAGVLLEVQAKVFAFQERLEGSPNDETVSLVMDFIERTLCCAHPSLSDLDRDARVAYAKQKLNRPLRVCGMVKNEGEPGGGPFWAVNSDGTASLQIVESAQIDLENARTKAIADSATHFNPVDLVCSLKDYRGRKFDLLRYRDPQTGFISYKSKDGRDLKAQELPGLWNGAMSDWNTLFVEVPIITFNPVKTVNDLLREQHQ